MARSTSGVTAIFFGLCLAAIPAFAHHSLNAEFQMGKPTELKGTLTKVEWTNPHARIYISVKEDDGSATIWDFELASPNGLMRKGWNRNSAKIGDTLTLMGYRAKDGSKMANTRSVSMPDGRKIFAGSSDDGGPTQ